MDPEQIYQEVLQEEQQKGSAAPVAEGRAKAARQRAVSGSPHPKEPKWWPGAQPHLEGAEGAEAEPAAEAEPEPEPEPEPTPEPAPEPAAEPEPAPAPAAEAPAAAPAPAAAAPDAAAAQAPAEVGGPAGLPDQAPAGAPPPAAEAPAAYTQAPAAEAPAAAPARPSGVSHGTSTGARLRPEDGVSTQSQFDAQQAMYQRRKLIDDLVASGVPAATAEDTGRPGGALLALLYVLIPIIAIVILAGREDTAPAEPPPPANGGGAPAEDAITVTAENIAFDTDLIEVAAGEDVSIHFVNRDPDRHNISVYPDQQTGLTFEDQIFEGEIITEGEITYDFTAPDEPGDNHFQCDVHPNMNGTFRVE